MFDLQTLGDEFLVNSVQAGGQAAPVITATADGGFFIAWTDGITPLGNTANADAVGRLFDSNGSAISAAAPAHATIAGGQSASAATLLADGSVLVAYTDGVYPNYTGRVVRFDAAGTRLGDVALPARGAVLAALQDGGYVAVWGADNAASDTDSAIVAQLFDADGTARAAAFRVNSEVSGPQTGPTVAVLNNGDFVVAWSDPSRELDQPVYGDVVARRFTASGAALGADVLVAGGESVQTRADIAALADGGYVIAWDNSSASQGDGSFASIEAQSFDSSGAALGDRVLVNSVTLGLQLGPTVAALDNGSYVVAWQDAGTLGPYNRNVKAQVLGAAGNRLGGEFLVNTRTVGTQWQPEALALSGGRFVIAWQDGDTGFSDPDSDIRAQIFGVTGYASRVGGSGNDVLTAAGNTDTSLFGQAGDDTLSGGGGNDTLDGGTGSNKLGGGTGNDSYFVNGRADIVVEGDDAGIDTVYASGGYYLWDNIEALELVEADFTGFFGVGNDLGNYIGGNSGANLLIGQGGNDTIIGNGGADALFGQDDDDNLYGGAGIDYLVGGHGADSLDGGADPDVLYGEEGDDWLDGGDSFDTDILVGGEGDDTLDGASRKGDYDLMDGGGGDDRYFVDSPDDLTFEAVSGGTDTVYADIDGAGYYLYPFTENLVLVGLTPFGVGNALANQLTGNGEANYLLGGPGDDTLNGASGNDVLFGEGGADVFVFERYTGGDVIGDFAPGTDKIDIRGIFANFAQLQPNLVEVAGTSAINLGSGDLIVINGVTNIQLSAADFLFG